MDLNTSPQELKAKADDLYAKQDYAGAVVEYRKLLDLMPTSVPVLKSFGLALTLTGQPEEGIQFCAKAATMQPADADVRYAYGYALGAANHFGEAIPELDAALNLQPNHIPARQGLIYCLMNAGQAAASPNPVFAEQCLTRAHKLDTKNAHLANSLLEFYVGTQQKGKAIKFVQSLDDSVKSQSPLKDQLDRLSQDPEFSTHLKVAAASKPSAPPSPAAPTSQAIKQVPCPNCKQMIMDYAAICPHCNFRIRATGTFAGMDTGPKHEWQEIAYTIMSIIWIALAGLDLARVLPTAMKEGFSGPSTFSFIIACVQILIGFGVLFRQEWLAFIAKIFCYLTLLTSGYMIMISWGFKDGLGAALHALQITVAMFMVYLINYVIGD